jgi:DNA primase
MAFLEKNSQIADVFLCLDADEAGHEAAGRIAAALAEDERFGHIRVSVTPPQAGKDYNDALQQVVAQRQKQHHADRHKEAGCTL